MIAFHGDTQLKADMIAELAEHRKRDQIIKGSYGQGSNGDWKGCAVGCSIHSLNKKRGTTYSTGDHEAYEKGFGIPRQLAYLQDAIFENLPAPQYLDWPMRFMEAPRPGADLSLITARFMVWLLVDTEAGVIRFSGEQWGVKESIERVAALYGRLIEGGAVANDEWSSARSAASAAESARSAARSAAWSAASSAWSARRAARSAAESAAWSAWSAASSAWSAAESARSAARSAAESAAWSAWSAAYVKMADKLIQLMEAA